MAPDVHRISLPTGESLVVDWYAPPRRDARLAIYVHGLGSNRRGEKALHFAERFAGEGWAFAAFDFRGHGESGGSMRDLTMTRLLEDLAAVVAWLRQRADGSSPLLIGSSMGAGVCAWHAMGAGPAHPPLWLIAPSLQFPARLIAELDPRALELWRRHGVFRFVSEWVDLEIGSALLDDAERYPYAQLLARFATPTFLMHGMQDATIDWRRSVEFAENVASRCVETLILQGDHRLTARKDLLFDAAWAWLQARERGTCAGPGPAG